MEGIIEYAAFSDWLLSFSNMHLKLLCIFSWLDSSSFLVLDNTPLSEYTTLM